MAGRLFDECHGGSEGATIDLHRAVGSKGALEREIQRKPWNVVRAEDSEVVTLFGGMGTVGMYYTVVELGGQEAHVQIDTGSSTLAAPMVGCEDCKRNDRRYDVAKSPTGQIVTCSDAACSGGCFGNSCASCSNEGHGCCSSLLKQGCHFSLSYADGSGASGALVRDEMKWGIWSVNVTFGGILHDSKDFEREGVDGIFGIGYSKHGCHPACVDSPFIALVANGIPDIFSICILPSGGAMRLGGEFPEAATEAFTYSKAVEGMYWTVRVTGHLQVGGQQVAVRTFPSTAVVDSGTTLLGLPGSVFDEVKRVFQTQYCTVPGLCGAQSWFESGSCGTLTMADAKALPDIELELEGGIKILLEPQNYMIPYIDDGTHYLCLGLMKTGSSQDIILGNTVMTKYVTVFDRQNQRVGFALAKAHCGAERGSGDTRALSLAAAPDAPWLTGAF